MTNAVKIFSGKRSGKGLRKAVRSSILLLFVLAIASCSRMQDLFSGNETQLGAMEQPETLVTVTRGSITPSQSFVGNLQYSQSAVLTWKTSGVIEKVYVKVGDRVKKGDILAVLETDSLFPSVILAEKTMIERKENLEDVKASKTAQMNAYKTLNAKESALKKAKMEQEALYYPRSTRQEMEIAWDKLALANLNFNYAKQDYDHLLEANVGWEGSEEGHWVYRFGRAYFTGVDQRSARERKFEDYVSTYNTLVSAYENYLWVAGQPSESDYAIAEGNVRVAQLEYDKALGDYLSYTETPREKDVYAAQISLNNAETNYNQRFIIAQFDGTVTSVTAVEGYYVTAGSTALRLDDMSRIFIPISIPELDISTVSGGASVSIRLDALSGKTYTGHIRSISDAGSTSGNTSSFSAVVEIDDPDERLLAGLTAEVSVRLNDKTGVLLVPNEAITYVDGIPSVTVVNDSSRRTVEISIGITTDDITEVTSANLEEGWQLAAAGRTGRDFPEGSFPNFGEGSFPNPGEGSFPDFPAAPAGNERQNRNGS